MKKNPSEGLYLQFIVGYFVYYTLIHAQRVQLGTGTRDRGRITQYLDG